MGDNMETLKQQASCCGAGCACHAGEVSGKAKMLIGVTVLLVAAVLVVKAVTKTSDATTKTPVAGYAMPTGDTATPPAAGTGKTLEAGTPAIIDHADNGVGTLVSTLTELNTLAANSDAVFVYLPGNEAGTANPPFTALESAVRTIGKQGAKCALFTLKAGSPDYAKLAPQTVVPGVLAMVKDKGMSAVSGEITETKLVQGYVAASSASGCSGGSCGSGGCE